ncbi:hypothetical protein G6O67_002175 [Ophiocordyceps sinensis]|uniref:Uncharacterized protein n=1 Tax=Ophiocordyceps sinensis TaxID=72228 RepID=A0A8H4V709_9HYPO|nr:hypothetical protein G6O67_002175 [Ophiocordyceps sinensis]
MPRHTTDQEIWDDSEARRSTRQAAKAKLQRQAAKAKLQRPSCQVGLASDRIASLLAPGGFRRCHRCCRAGPLDPASSRNNTSKAQGGAIWQEKLLAVCVTRPRGRRECAFDEKDGPWRAYPGGWMPANLS